jgi:hypothetical protein
MWIWALRGSRHFEPMSYSVQPHWPHRGELIIVSLGCSESAIVALFRSALTLGEVAPSVVAAPHRAPSRLQL